MMQVGNSDVLSRANVDTAKKIITSLWSAYNGKDGAHEISAEVIDAGDTTYTICVRGIWIITLSHFYALMRTCPTTFSYFRISMCADDRKMRGLVIHLVMRKLEYVTASTGGKRSRTDAPVVSGAEQMEFAELRKITPKEYVPKTIPNVQTLLKNVCEDDVQDIKQIMEAVNGMDVVMPNLHIIIDSRENYSMYFCGFEMVEFQFLAYLMKNFSAITQVHMAVITPELLANKNLDVSAIPTENGMLGCLIVEMLNASASLIIK